MKTDNPDDRGYNGDGLVYYAADGEDKHIVDKYQRGCEQDTLSERLRITRKRHGVNGKANDDEYRIESLPCNNAVCHGDSGEYVRYRRA